MDSPVSLSTQHKLPITVLGKSQEKHLYGLPEGFVVCTAYFHLSRSLRGWLHYCWLSGYNCVFRFFSHISTENYTPREGHESQILQMIIAVCVTWVDCGTGEQFFFIQISEYFIAILGVFGETANLRCSNNSPKDSIWTKPVRLASIISENVAFVHLSLWR